MILQYHPSVKRIAKRMVVEGLRSAMESGVSAAVHISGRTKRERARIISVARDFRYFVKIVLIKCSPENCLARCKNDAARPKTTDWKPIIDRWFFVFQPVSSDEYDEYTEMEI